MLIKKPLLSNPSQLLADFRFDELLAKRTLESDPNFRWCINRGCLGGQILAHDGNSCELKV